MDRILEESRSEDLVDSKSGKLEVPTKAVEEGIKVVRGELERAGVKVEEED